MRCPPGGRRGIDVSPRCHLWLKAPLPKSRAYPRDLWTLGDHLRKVRLDWGLLQREVAHILGVDETSVHNWEAGRRAPDLPAVPKIIQFLGYTPWGGKSRMPGERLRAYRWTRGMTQEEMARRLGVDPGTLAGWERGKGGCPGGELVAQQFARLRV